MQALLDSVAATLMRRDATAFTTQLPAGGIFIDDGPAPWRLDRMLQSWRSVEAVTLRVTGEHVLVTKSTDHRPPEVFWSVTCAVVGRDEAGRRSWWRAEGVTLPRSRRGAPRVDAIQIDRPTARLQTAERDMFTDVTSASGVARADPSLAERGFHGLLSHGAAAADVDGDGRIDIFAAGLARHALYRNIDGVRFEDVADAAGVAASEAPACAPLFFDADDDGDQDLLLTGLGHATLFENLLVPDGALRFRDVTASAGLREERAQFSACAGDIDGDGDEDVLIAAYGDYGHVLPDSWTHAGNGQPDLLYVNDGGLRFHEEAAARGVADPRWGYACLMADIDDDRDLDILVANDFGGAVGAFVNDGTGHFTDEASQRGLGAPSYGMGLSLGDFDRDGDLDLHVTKSSSVPGTSALRDAPREVAALAAGDSLYRNDGAGRFTDVTAHAGPFPAGWGWGGGFFDANADGWPDLYVPNGFLTGSGEGDTEALFWEDVARAQSSGKHDPLAFLTVQGDRMVSQGEGFSGRQRDAVFMNRRDGTFADVSGPSGLDSATDGRAAVFADVDDDGDTDVFLRAMHEQAHLLWRNESRARFVRIALQGARMRDASGAGARDAFGATVRVTSGGRTTAQAKLGGCGFLAERDPRLTFDLAEGERVDAIEIAWPNGDVQRYPGVADDTSWLAVEGEATLRPVAARATPLPAK